MVGLTKKYTLNDIRMDAAASVLLVTVKEAVVSYRHCESLEDSCAKIEELADTNIEVLWADVFLKKMREVEDREERWIQVGMDL